MFVGPSLIGHGFDINSLMDYVLDLTNLFSPGSLTGTILKHALGHLQSLVAHFPSTACPLPLFI